jgi:hypothetical protein
LHALTTGSGNVALGVNAGNVLTTGSNNVDVANSGVAGDTGRIRIGTASAQSQAFLAGVFGVVPPGATKAVVVNSSGQLGTATLASGAPAPSVSRLQVQLRTERRRVDQLAAQLEQLRRLVVGSRHG